MTNQSFLGRRAIINKSFVSYMSGLADLDDVVWGDENSDCIVVKISNSLLPMPIPPPTPIIDQLISLPKTKGIFAVFIDYFGGIMDRNVGEPGRIASRWLELRVEPVIPYSGAERKKVIDRICKKSERMAEYIDVHINNAGEQCPFSRS